MSLALTQSPVIHKWSSQRRGVSERLRLPEVVGEIESGAGCDEALTEDASPYGLLGLERGELALLKEDHIRSLAVGLAMHARRGEIHDDHYVAQYLARRPDWCERYRVVHLIEKSLWIQGRSDLVMTLIRNPSQIPDNPPPQILKILSEAYARHPQATIWYGVPLFSAQTNDQGLPIPLTAAEIREEASKRLAAARKDAARWRPLYRAPGLGYDLTIGSASRVGAWTQSLAAMGVDQWRRMRRDARRRARAAIKAQFQHVRCGRSDTELPEHSSTLGQMMTWTSELISRVSEISAPAVAGTSVLTTPLLIAKVLPLLLTPMPVIACDPFLFLELPEEPGKLRMLGHWFWQTTEQGQRLHLHT